MGLDQLLLISSDYIEIINNIGEDVMVTSLEFADIETEDHEALLPLINKLDIDKISKGSQNLL